ncbi:ATP-binding cassette domain-containing protein [Finegoldia sp. BIOML-A3]|uniref:ABC transporter ATP-binding protein n=1 Tax=Finegoldia TaxID=150022 RepID=UPI0012AF3C78|nr:MULTISPECIES: ABC transporter ATP-binding protein [Finegoldia]MSA99678.1 ATP-binding cassette domain-containing protein [Finegoldia sp. BIOML-A3]MSB17385.1 ATP-binding cassette domain-containing protein [Finegoldia magna]MSB93664.1 ATP-binding cassette domain-containing protein [Finegoldia sp. BIOML-A4]MSD46123.1 ATP-binding cassette domain-containing protein [Finegoldia magna]
MKEFYKKRFALTDKGARNLSKATLASFFVYCTNMLPAMLLMIFAQEVLENMGKSKGFYIAFSVLTLIAMYILLSIEYDKLYRTTYQESADLRIRTAEYLSKLPLSYFSKHDISDLSQTIMSDIEGIEHAMSHSIPKVGGMVLFFPLISIMMLVSNVKMGLAVIIPSLLSFIFIPLSKKYQVKGHKRYYDILRKNSESFQENIEMQMEIKAYGLSEEMKEKLYKKMDKSEKVHLKAEITTILTMSISSIFSFISLAVVILFGVNLIINKEISVLYLVGYLLAAIKLKDSLDASKEGMMEIFYLSPKIERLKEIQNQNLQEGEDYNLQKFDIDLKDVEFAYKKDVKVLNGVSFKAKQGEVTALVGASGCGKTTILKLISRLYDYDEGQILIDGKDIKEISTESLFDKVSIVFQDVVLFNQSVMENIRLGKQDASDEEVKRAAKLANCTDFIEKMDKGFDTVIGENGAELSGGERQRLSIARAFLKDAPILILDEIAASLDVDNEKKIQESLNNLVKDKTVVIISHRMKSIENADKIVVLENGKVESEGKHEELLQKSKVYKNLIEKTKMAEEFIY